MSTTTHCSEMSLTRRISFSMDKFSIILVKLVLLVGFCKLRGLSGVIVLDCCREESMLKSVLRATSGLSST